MVMKIQGNSPFNTHMGELGIVVHTSHPSTWGAEAGQFMCIEISSETLSQNQ